MQRRMVFLSIAVLGLARPAVAQHPGTPGESAIARARADSVRRPYTKADIDFVNGMIHHHAQAILMAGWATTHGASPSVQVLAGRIINAQQDETRLMQQWLAERNQALVTPNPYGMPMTMGGMQHEMLMPGMLTREELASLDSARGPAFDLVFLQRMVRHHEGAVGMVKQLFATPGAGQDETIFKLASDINVDQTTEVARMKKMIATFIQQPTP